MDAYTCRSARAAGVTCAYGQDGILGWVSKRGMPGLESYTKELEGILWNGVVY